MSETVFYVGKLTKIERLENETLEQQCKRVLLDHGVLQDLPDYYDDYEEFLSDKLYEKVVVHKGNLYKVDKINCEQSDIFEARKNSDETIEFKVRYYNGGCSFNTAIEYALDEIKGEL